MSPPVRRCFILPGLLLPLLLSCSHEPRVEAFEAGIGRLTQHDLRRQFGDPQRLKRMPGGTEAWDYEFLAGDSRCVGYRVFFDEDQRSTGWEPRSCSSGH